MFKLHVTPEQALDELKSIPHQRFHEALPQYWHVDANGYVKSQDVCWLFCWAKTGLNSDKAAKAAAKAFTSILEVSFEDFESHVPHEWARWARYAKGNIDEQLNSYLNGEFFRLMEVAYFNSQGIQLSAETRRAIESHAMATARKHYEAKGYKVVDKSANNPYDLKCTKQSETLYVEVKGTQSSGEQILLTPREVRFNRGEFQPNSEKNLFSSENRPNMELFVLSQITISQKDDIFIASGGLTRILNHWRIPSAVEETEDSNRKKGEIWPVSYAYALPN